MLLNYLPLLSLDAFLQFSEEVDVFLEPGGSFKKVFLACSNDPKQTLFRVVDGGRKSTGYWFTSSKNNRPIVIEVNCFKAESFVPKILGSPQEFFIEAPRHLVGTYAPVL